MKTLKGLGVKEDLKDLFFIVKGQYRKDNDPSGISISGFDPESPNTYEWYMVMDNIVFNTFHASSSLEGALDSISNLVQKRKTRREYLKYVCEHTSEDYYEVTYLGHAPLSDEMRSIKCEGKCPRTSPSTKALYQKVFNTFGDHFCEEVDDAVTRGYSSVKNNTPAHKAKKVLKRAGLVKETPSTPHPTPLKKVGEVKEEKTLIMKKVTPLKKKVLVKK